jgi:uncharacterized Zn-binding protein involved in type VI secretion
MSKLWAVEGDPNSHSDDNDPRKGELIADGASSLGTVKINGKKVIVHKSSAKPDKEGHPLPPTDTAEGSGTVFCYGAPAHREDDRRECGATTIVTGQSTVKIG